MFERYSFISEFGCLDQQRLSNELPICRLFKNDTLSLEDFLDEVDSGTRHVNMENVCGYYSTSVNILNEESRRKVLKKYQNIYKNAPQKGNFVHIFTTSNTSCAIVKTVSKSDRWHCSLFKSDNFVIEEVVIQETIVLD